ncbi:ATP-dependent RNA helicase DDX54-like [Mercenaria mercenaria]|uniref:ATP-dependent RNA helicase DDX54-like n=1 Tax=Mercenaria mercenaria TaxID=6596 RepID=UPI00234F3BD8|nr:ATP-dependent RNA helicase DDX54-like [Mercenaria mercenaria]
MRLPLLKLGKYTGLRAAVVLGGDRMEDQFAALHSNPDIIVATPGRFMHVAVEMDLKLKSVQYVVFDEADRLFEMGFQEQLNEILNRLPESRQTVLFSATLPKLLVDFAKAGLHDPTLIRLDVDTKLSDQLKLSFLQCRADDKLGVLLHVLRHVIPSGEQTVVFAATKHHVEYLNLVLQKAEISCTYIYSSLDPTARKINLAKFQHRKVMVMIVTDLAARGIDIPLLDNVINYNFPAKAKLFVHRVGRVARAGRSGVAYSLIAPDEVSYVVDLHVFLGRPVKFVPLGKQVKDKDGLYGTVPQTIIDDLAETIFAWHEESYDIKAMVKVCSNAYGHYIRSRPAPAPESVKRVKEMEKLGQHIGTHPMFGLEEDTSEAERLKLLNALKSYKSNTTIFEVNSTAKNSSFSVMKKKRNYHDKVVESKQRKVEENRLEPGTEVEDRSSGQDTADEAALAETFTVVIGGKQSTASQDSQSGSSLQIGKKRKKKGKEPVRDEENYISYRPSDYQTEQGLRLGSSFDREASGAVLDLAGDDESINKKRTNALKWDRKKKKYVRESNEDPKKKKIRTESGALIPASYKSNAYKEWVKKSKTDIQVEKDEEEDDDAPQKQNRTKNKLAVLGVTEYNRRHVKGSDVGYQGNKRDKFKRKGSELKRPEQIAKARKLKAKKEAFQSQRQHKHKVNKAKHKSKK